MIHIETIFGNDTVRTLSLVLLCYFVSFIASCSVNPVTGQKEMKLVSTLDEIKIGIQNYPTMQQTEGGLYITDPELTRYVQKVGDKLANVSDRKLPYEFVIINNSVPNAWALPGGKIGVNRGLLTHLNSEAELAAVLGHEIVHAAAKHSVKKMEKAKSLNIGLVVLGMSQQNNENAQMIMTGGMLGAAILNQAYSRDSELEADKYGIDYMMRAGYDPYAAVELQKTFVKLFSDNKSDWLSGLFASHPPSQQRVKANLVRANRYKNRKGLFTGEFVYKFKTRKLMRANAAYQSYDMAETAVKNKRYSRAEMLVDKALTIENNEALFYGLKGDIHGGQGNHYAAIDFYSQAIKLNPGLFYFYLKRGMSYKATNQPQLARKDLMKSMELLPTREAKQSLQKLTTSYSTTQNRHSAAP